MLLLDTSGLIAALFPDQDRHDESARALRAARGPLILSPFVLAEVDYLIAKFGGVGVQLALLAEVGRGAYTLARFDAEDIEAARTHLDRYRDLGLGLSDASIAVLSRRYRTLDLLTLDERYFRVVTGHQDRPFRLLPADSSRTSPR